jgi:mono/diheme cytochrome c family protein
MRLAVIIGGCALLLVSCVRERPSERTPIHLNPNMDDTPRYDPQERSRFFADGATMRTPVEGTVARGELRDGDPDSLAYYTGRDSKGNLVRVSPVVPTMESLRRGQERYDIYCSPCHGRVGAEEQKGIVVQRGMLPPPTYHDERLRNIEDGHIYDVITNGIRNMPGYKSQIPVADRWAIVNYFRALQRSQHADEADVPENLR